VTGHLYIAASEDGLVIFTVTLTDHDQGTLLAAALQQRGFPSVHTRGKSVSFATDLNRQPLGAILDAIGLSLGGIDYRMTLHGYQGGGVTMSERFTFEVTKGPFLRVTETGEDSECG
jgi:hypothetical protein